MPDQIVIEKPKPEQIVKEVELPDIPVITKRKIDNENLRFAFDMQTKKLTIEFNLETEFSGEVKNQIARKHMLARDEDYDYAFDAILPNDDEVVWTNPQQSFFDSMLNMIKNKIIEEG